MMLFLVKLISQLIHVTPHLIRQVYHQYYVEGVLIKQEYTSADTYKLNLNALKVKILQISVLNLIHQSFIAEIK
jgi:hypothetical protein